MSTFLFDTHAHLQLDDFHDDRAQVIHRAAEAGVRAILNVGFSVETTEGAISLAERHEVCWATAGLHPHDAEEWNDDLRDRLQDVAQHPKVLAIGETGLDYYRDLSPRDAQARAFHGQIRLAAALELPLVIHNRDATDDVLTTLEERAAGLRVALHCFSGDQAAVERALGLGCVFGLGGPVTFKKSNALRDVVRSMPADSFFVETDAPWLAPQFRRGKRNEPAYVRSTAECIAEVRGESLEALTRQTTENAARFFRLNERPEWTADSS